MHLITTWEGGMSFHGGLAGVAIAVWLFCRRNKLQLLPVSDMIAAVAPVGLFFGRLANFVNGELWGKPADVPWAMVFPRADNQPRHPSQLYEAALEGILLFVVLQICLRVFRLHERPGLISAIFLASYGLLRFVVEFFREPDTPFLGWFSMGHALSVALLLAGGYLAFLVLSKPKAA
jgi:phosphatidylglycerol:prolipoprotein diacylglycerol transferase